MGPGGLGSPIRLGARLGLCCHADVCPLRSGPSPSVLTGDCTPCVTGSEVERPWRPDKSNAIGSIVGIEWHIGEEGLDLLGQLKVLDLSISHLVDVSLDLLGSLLAALAQAQGHRRVAFG